MSSTSELGLKRARFDELVREITALSDDAVARNRPLTDAEHQRAAGLFSEAKSLKDEIKLLERSKSLSDQVRNLGRIGEPGATIPGWASYAVGSGSTGTLSLEANLRSTTDAPLRLAKFQIEALREAGVAGRYLKAVVTSDEAADATVPQYLPSTAGLRREPTRVLDLIPKQPTDAPIVYYHKITTGTTAASVVAEGDTKPQSNPVIQRAQADVAKIAHWVEVTDEVLQDSNSFRSVIDDEMRAGVINEENHQLLLGTGTGDDMTGILNTANIITRAKGSETSLETVHLAAMDLRTGADYTEPDVVVLHPDDYSQMATVKDTTGRYIAGDPLTGGPPTLWGFRVLLTTQLTAGTGMVANLAQAAIAFIRQQLTVEANGQGETQFKNNTVLIRAEERLALAVVRPKSVVKVTGI